MATMATQQSPPKRPRLSLQIKTSCSPSTRSSRSYNVDPRDPTAFNTLSNVYVTAIERSTPTQREPITAINTLQSFSITSPIEYKDAKQRVVTPYVTSYPETPVTAHPTSPPKLEMTFPSSMTATPPLSAGPVDHHEPKVFTFSSIDTACAYAYTTTTTTYGTTPQSEPRSARRRTNPFHGPAVQPPYTHPRSLHSILRNSPLPPNTAIPPPSPRRQSLRLWERAVKRVGYNNPLTQEIVTNKYTKSHIDLLVEEASPSSPVCSSTESDSVMDMALAFAPNEIQDGGQTPGPFEDMRRRMAGLASNNIVSPAGPRGIQKRKKKEKKRRWVWTIGQEEEDEDDAEVGGAVAAIRAQAAKEKLLLKSVKAPTEDGAITPIAPIPKIAHAENPTPSIESAESGSETFDVEMSDADSFVSDDRGFTPSEEADLDLKTPTAPPRLSIWPPMRQRDTPIPELMGMLKRDTPIPPELVMVTATTSRNTPVPTS